MKKLLIALFLFISASAMAQVDIIANPVSLTLTTTSETEYRINRMSLRDDLPKLITVLVLFPSANAGTIQLSSYGSVTSSPAYSNTTHPNGVFITIKGSLYVKASSANDKIEIIY